VGPMISLRFWDNQRKNHWVIQGSVGYGRMAHNNAMIKRGTNDPEPIELTPTYWLAISGWATT